MADDIGEIEAKFENCLAAEDGSLVLSLRVPKSESFDAKQIVQKLKAGLASGKERLKIKVKWWRNKRSLNANSYFWQLCGKIAEQLKASKEEIYQRFIREQPVFKVIEISEDAVETFITAWGMHGIGWIAEKVDYSRTKGFVVIHAYYGSSAYNIKQMSRLIDSIVDECKELGIETKTPDELASMIKEWECQR